MKVSIFKHPIEVTNRLAERATSKELLLAMLDAMVTAKSECTDNDPSGSRGWRAWQMGTRRNREVHVGVGDWAKDNTDQVPSIVSKKLGIRIVVCNTDDGTCVDASSPQNSSKKGVGNERAVDANQLSFIDQLEAPAGRVVPFSRITTSAGPVVTYYFCAHIEGDDVRAELSCPTSFESGYFSEFVERIYIVGGDTPLDDGTKKKSSGDGDSEYDIPVKLKRKN